MKLQKIACLLSLVASLLVPSLAKAQQFILDTGMPSIPASTNYVIGGSSSIEAAFSATAGQTVTLLSAYLAPDTGGSTFTFDIYSSVRTTGNRTSPVYVDLGTFASTGWTSSVANWTVPTTGTYYLALQGSTGNNFDAPAETSTTTGTVPALGFYSAGSSSFYYAASNTPIGLQITATPEPSSWLLAIVCVGAFIGLRRTTRARL